MTKPLVNEAAVAVQGHVVAVINDSFRLAQADGRDIIIWADIVRAYEGWIGESLCYSLLLTISDIAQMEFFCGSLGGLRNGPYLFSSSEKKQNFVFK